MIVKFHRILYKHRSREVGHELITGNFDGNNTGSYRISSSQQFGTSGYFQEYFWKIVCTAYRKFVMLILVSTLTTTVIAVPFDKAIGHAGDTLLIPGICLCITSVILYFADRLPAGKKSVAKATYRNAIFVGLAQAVATLPGISRSGSTITAGLACGYTRKFTVKYSFIMSIPAVLGAVILEIPDLFKSSISGTDVVNYIVGMVVAGVVGYLCIKFMLYTVKKKNFKGFSIYCMIAGIVSVIWYFVA